MHVNYRKCRKYRRVKRREKFQSPQSPHWESGVTVVPLLFSGLDTALEYILLVCLGYLFIYLKKMFIIYISLTPTQNSKKVELGCANCTVSWCLRPNAPAHPPLPLAHAFSHLLRGPGTAEVILGTGTGLGFWPPNFPGNWKQVWTSPPPEPPASPGLGARGDRQEIYEQLELAAMFRGREHGVNQGSHCVRAGRAL